MPLLSAHLSHLARSPRRHPLWSKSSQPGHRRRQEGLPTLCLTAHLPACPWAPPPKARSSRPPSRPCPSPPSPTVGPRTRQPSWDPGLLGATPGPLRGARRPGLATLCPTLVPRALGTPWRGSGLPALVTLSSPPTSRQEENHLTQRSPSSPASQANPSSQAPLSLPTPLGLPLPMGFHRLRVLPGLGIRGLALGPPLLPPAHDLWPTHC